MSIAGGIGAAVRLPTPAARFGVEVQAARSPGRTRFRRGAYASTALTDVATVTRATQAWGVDQGGVVSSVAAGQPVVTTAGLAVYEARTNSVRNPTPQGAVVGVLGSGGSLPTNWSHAGGSTAGLTPSVVATGSEFGMTYVDIRYAGTTSATSFALTFESGTGIAAAAAQVWTGSALARLVGGSASNVTGYYLQVDGIGGSAGTGLGGSSALTSAATKLTATYTLGAGATNVRPTIVFALNNGAAVDFTVRIYYGNIKQGADIGDPPILQTNNAAATRNADVIIEPVNIQVGQSFTVQGVAVAPNGVASTFPTVFELRDAANQNSLAAHFDGANNFFYAVATSGGSAPSYAGGALDAARPSGTVLRFAISVTPSSIKWSVNGGAVKTLTALANGPFQAALTLLGLGCRVAGGNQLNSTLRELSVAMRAFSDAELQTASDVSLTHDIDFVSQVYQYVGAPYVTPTDLPGTTFTRATTGTSRVGATILNFAAGVLKITSAGCLFEAQKTNVVRYSEGTTATIGTWGATGSGPNDGANGVSQGGALNGLVISTSAKGTYADGCDWWEFTLAGTPTASSSTGFYLDANSLAGAASSGQTWVSAVDLEFMSITGCTGSTIQTFGRKSDGSSNEGGGLVNLPTTPTSRARYASGAYTMADALTARVSGGVFFAYTSGVPLNVVVRVTAAQVERDYVSSYKKTTGSAVTGNGDILASANDYSPTAYTVVAEFTVPTSGPAYAHVWTYDDGNASGARSFVYYDRSTSKLYASVENGGVSQALLDLGVVTPGQAYKVAFAVAANDFAAIRSGGTVQVDTSGTVPSTSSFRIGQALGGANHLTANVQRIRRFSVRKTNTELQALVA